METLTQLSKEQKKLIIFTDNRQDTALQSEHLNEFQRRVTFRQNLYHAFKYISENNLRVTDIEVGKTIFEYLQNKNLLPDYQKEIEDEFSSAPPPTTEFIEFLTFLTLSDIMQSQYFLDLNLDKLGILKIEYDGLENLAKHNVIDEIPRLRKLSEDERYDYIRGVLDIFRWYGAISNSIFNDTVSKYEDWANKFKEEILFDINKSRWNIVGFTYDNPKDNRKEFYRRQRVIFKSISWHNTTLINWTKSFFNVSTLEAAEKILTKTIEVLEKTRFLTTFWTDRSHIKLYQIREGKMLFKFNAKRFLRCPKCYRIHYFKTYRECTRRNCPPLEEKEVDQNHFYVQLYKQLPQKEAEIHSKEHSAQIDGKIREQFEINFQDPSIGSTNVLVCTPTMELGIDIGDLSAIIMRNVPPDPSRYAQRAGRAGRKNQPSIVLVFCGTGMAKGPHDQYFYNEPEKIVSGKINPPNFLLDNKKLIRKHIYSAIIETVDIRIPTKIEEIIDLDNHSDNYPFFDSIKKNIVDNISNNSQYLEETLTRIFENELKRFDWLDNEFLKATISTFYQNLNRTLDSFRETYARIIVELDYLHIRSKSKGSDAKENREYYALQRKLTDMRKGKRPYDSFSFLKNYGFLPNYGFPSDSSLLTMYNPNKSEYNDNWRSSVIAIREFAPYNQIYFLGNKYAVSRAMIKTDKGEVDVDKIYICDSCNEILINTKNTSPTSFVNCPNCGEKINLNNFMTSIKFPHMYSISGPRITCDEENRQIRGYEVTINYKHENHDFSQYEFLTNKSAIGTISYEHNGRIFMVNKGTISKSKTSNEREVHPFNFCSACGEWLFGRDVSEHVDKCRKGGTHNNIYENLWLFVSGNHDVLTFELPYIGDADVVSYYTTLKEAIIQSVILTYNLEESEINGFINPIPSVERKSIVIFETEEGGTGVLKSLLDTEKTHFDKFIENLFRILHIESLDPYKETMDACVTACYNCLLRFRNQLEHRFLDRKSILPLIKQLTDCSLNSVTQPEIDNETKLTQLKAKCDSELEKLVLDEIMKQKIPLPDEAQKEFYDRDVPIAIADFFYKNHLYVFVDGPVHEEKAVKKSDKEKREILEAKGYSVVVLDFKDGKYIEDNSLIEKEVAKLKDYIE